MTVRNSPRSRHGSHRATSPIGFAVSAVRKLLLPAALLSMGMILMACGPDFEATDSKGPKGEVSGTVTDAEKNPLEEVMIFKTKTPEKGPQPDILPVTDSKGFYKLANLPAGGYTLKFSLNGYRPVEKEVTVEADKTARLDVVLEKE